MRIPFALLLTAATLLAQDAAPPKFETITGKTILLFSPHPDDDAFCCGGALARLAAQGNKVYIAIYTNDDKGSYDPDMTSEQLARIRKAEEEASMRILGIPAGNIIWMGHHDGMLEYVELKRLTEQATELIRRHRPDIVMTVDPGDDYIRWHKSDHRMAALNTLDAIRAAEWHLYFPNHRLQLGLQPWKVPAYLFYYVTEKDANYFVDIHDVWEKKVEAGLAHVSQFEPAVKKYRPDWTPQDKAAARKELEVMNLKRNGRWVEAYRYATGFNQF
jgi:LmbE family N-acetylglucosaminyl deacetylase